MQALTKKVIYLDSKNASIVDLTKGLATFQYPQPIEGFGEGTKIGVHKFTYTNFFVNISAPNNVIYYSNDSGAPTKYAITIPQGSWSMKSLTQYISATVLQETGLSVFTIGPNPSTGKAVVSFGNVVGWFVNFTATRPPILGFNVQHIPANDNNTAFYNQEAPNPASFNSITAVKVSTDLAQDSIDNSSLSSNVIHVSSPWTVSGDVQVDEVFNILYVSSMKLSGKTSSITIQILDQDNQPIALSEHFQLSLVVI